MPALVPEATGGQLIDEVLYPSKNILDGYESFAVELTNGRVFTGIIRSETADELTLIDAAGAKQVIKLTDVDNKKKTGKSVMPDGLQGGLTPVDFADLIGFLETLRVHRLRMIDDAHHDHGPPAIVHHIAGEGTDAFQITGLQVAAADAWRVSEAAAQGAVHARDRKRRRIFGHQRAA